MKNLVKLYGKIVQLKLAAPDRAMRDAGTANSRIQFDKIIFTLLLQIWWLYENGSKR
jgi:hypothetical protein